MRRLNIVIIIIGALIAVSFMYLLQQSRLEELRLSAELASSRTESGALRKQVAQLSQQAAGDEELERLRSHQAEALKLRAEVTQLKKDLSAAKTAAERAELRDAPVPGAEKKTAALKVDALPEDNPEVAVHKTDVMRAEVSTNTAILGGGWRGESGRRMFVLIRPARNPDMSNGVSVMSNWFEVSDEAAGKLRLQIDETGEQVALLNDFSVKQFKDEFEKAGGGDFLTAPNVITQSGRQARISVTESRDTSSGPVEFGPKVDVLPTLAEDGSSLQLAFRAAMVESRKP